MRARTERSSPRTSLTSSPVDRPGLEVGVYFHFPYCISLCPYCDFDTQDTGLEAIPAYVQCLIQEVRQQPRVPVRSIFFGGGTPSLMSPARIFAVLEACRSHFHLSQDCEVTVEANPGDLSRYKTTSYHQAGVNRLSIGAQSFEDAELRLLGRRHSGDMVLRAYRAARDGGLDNVSLDLIYGVPGQSVDTWSQTLERAVELRPEHFSCYLLTLDPATPMGRQVEAGHLALPKEEDVCLMYSRAQMILGAAGYAQYEISNWALPGRESKHNLGYWRYQPYLGIGAGAVSCWGGARYKNTPMVHRYMEAVRRGERCLAENEVLDAETQRREALMMGLRLREGVSETLFRERYGLSLREYCGPALDELVALGHLEWQGERLRVAEGSLLLTNELLARLLP